MSFFELSLFQFEFTIKDIYSIIGQGFLNVSMLFILFFSFNFLSKKAKNAFLFNE